MHKICYHFWRQIKEENTPFACLKTYAEFWPFPSPLYLVCHFILAIPEGGLIADSMRRKTSVHGSFLLHSTHRICVLHFILFCSSLFQLFQNPVACCFQINFRVIFFHSIFHTLLPEQMLSSGLFGRVFPLQLQEALNIGSKIREDLTPHWACFTEWQFFFSS